MKKYTAIEVLSFIDNSIKKGHKVNLIDGSGLTPFEQGTKDYYIVYAYPNLTGSNLILKDIECEVIETQITNFVSLPNHFNTCYLLDVVVKAGNAKFRTCSKFIRKI